MTEPIPPPVTPPEPPVVPPEPPESWHSQLPDDMKDNETLTRFKDIPSLAKSYLHARSMVGADTIKMPKTDEEWESVYTQLGRPETPDTYLLQQAEDVNPALQDALKEDAEWFRSTAHKLGFNERQTTELFREFSKRMSDKYNTGLKLSETDNINTEVKMRTEYGSAYEGSKILMDRALKELGGDEFMALINSTGVSKQPAFMRAMFKVGKMMSEDLGLDRQTGQLIKTKPTIEGEIAHLMAQAGYADASHPEHTSLVQKVQMLNQQLVGTEPIPISSGVPTF